MAPVLQREGRLRLLREAGKELVQEGASRGVIGGVRWKGAQGKYKPFS